jgi:adenylate kinase
LTVKEFQCWLDGFSEAISKAPNEKQWKKIQERIKEIETTEKVVIERHYRDWWPRRYWTYEPQPYVVYGTSNATSAVTSSSVTFNSTNSSNNVDIYKMALKIGRDEAKSLS